MAVNGNFDGINASVRSVQASGGELVAVTGVIRSDEQIVKDFDPKKHIKFDDVELDLNNVIKIDTSDELKKLLGDNKTLELKGKDLHINCSIPDNSNISLCDGDLFIKGAIGKNVKINVSRNQCIRIRHLNSEISADYVVFEGRVPLFRGKAIMKDPFEYRVKNGEVQIVIAGRPFPLKPIYPTKRDKLKGNIVVQGDVHSHATIVSMNGSTSIVGKVDPNAEIFGEKFATINNQLVKPITNIFEAASVGNLTLVQQWAKRGDDINRGDENYTPVMIALKNGHFKVAKFLILSGADWVFRPNNNLISLEELAWQGKCINEFIELKRKIKAGLAALRENEIASDGEHKANADNAVSKDEVEQCVQMKDAQLKTMYTKHRNDDFCKHPIMVRMAFRQVFAAPKFQDDLFPEFPDIAPPLNQDEKGLMLFRAYIRKVPYSRMVAAEGYAGLPEAIRKEGGYKAMVNVHRYRFLIEMLTSETIGQEARKDLSEHYWALLASSVATGDLTLARILMTYGGIEQDQKKFEALSTAAKEGKCQEGFINLYKEMGALEKWRKLRAEKQKKMEEEAAAKVKTVEVVSASAPAVPPSSSAPTPPEALKNIEKLAFRKIEVNQRNLFDDVDEFNEVIFSKKPLPGARPASQPSQGAPAPASASKPKQ